MFWFFLFSIVLGASLGSFLNVAVLRAHVGASLRGRSQCVDCKKQILARDLIPVVSFFLLKGRCMHCKKHISWQYPAVELVLSLLFLWVAYFHFHYSGSNGLSLIFRDWYVVWIFAYIFLYDLLFMQVNVNVVTPAILTVFIVSGTFGWLTWLSMVYGACVGGGFFVAQRLVSRGKWVGSGDVFVGALLGVILGWSMIVIGLLCAYVIGAVVALFLLIKKIRKRTDPLPMASFFFFVEFVVLFWGNEMF